MKEKTKIKKYTKKPVTIEAYQITRELLESVLFDGLEYPKGLTMTSSSHNKTNRTINAWFGEVVTIHNQKTRVIEGDWIITEPDGIHHYPCKPDIFEATYSSATPSPALQDAVKDVNLIVALEHWTQIYEINVQFWGSGENNIFVEKGGVPLFEIGGCKSVESALKGAIEYIERINKSTSPTA